MASESFDYIIVGGGTSGLVVAARLIEDPNVSVLVLEAGESYTDDPRVTMPAGWSKLLGSDADWAFQTTEQTALKGRQFDLPQGRILGGSSAINATVYMMPSRSGFDAWAAMGNKSWDWQSMEPCFRKHSSINHPSARISKDLKLEESYKSTLKGRQGPVQASWPEFQDTILRRHWLDAFDELGFPFKGDVSAGEVIGAYSNPATVDPDTRQRSYAASYFVAAKDRPNFKLVTGATVQEIVFEQEEDFISATGVEYIHNSQLVTVHATKEVILAAGAYQSPKILELSGIGSPQILEAQGIETKIPLYGVGENLQDHLLAGISYEIKEGALRTLDDLGRHDPAALQETMQQYTKERRGPFTEASFNSVAFLPLTGIIDGNSNSNGSNSSPSTENVDTLLNAYPSAPADPPHHDYVRHVLRSPTEASGMYFIHPVQCNWGSDKAVDLTKTLMPGNYLTCCLLHLNPFSTGSSHITSASPSSPPKIDPAYLSHPLDIEVFARHLRHLDQSIMQTPALRSLIKENGRRNTVFEKQVSENGAGAFDGLEGWKEYIRKVALSNWHAVGTCAMLPKEEGGVVDEELRVYGTRNLRVVDASMMPVIPRANTVSTVYAVAERAGDVIRGRR